MKSNHSIDNEHITLMLIYLIKNVVLNVVGLEHLAYYLPECLSHRPCRVAPTLLAFISQ